MLICCSKNQSLVFCDETQKHTRLINATPSTKLALMRLNLKLRKLKYAQTHVYYDQVAWLPLSRAIK
jgi:hypothetical protein